MGVHDIDNALLMQVGILDQKNKLVPTGKIGEVCIQGPNVTKGYLNRPEANEEAFAGLPTLALCQPQMPMLYRSANLQFVLVSTLAPLAHHYTGLLPWY